MKPLSLAACAVALALSACAPSTPQVDVKTRWSTAIANYSFVPLYPPRSDMQLGEVRIHRIKEAGETLDSRLLMRAQDGLGGRLDFTSYNANLADALLPGFERTQVFSFDLAALGNRTPWINAFGSTLERQNSLYLSVAGLKTSEVPEPHIVNPFAAFMQHAMTEKTMQRAICSAAIYMGDPDLEDTGISVITRIIYASKIEYKWGTGFSTAPGGSVTSTGTTPTPPAAPKSPQITDTSRSFAAFDDKGTKLAIGVDAIMAKVSDMEDYLPALQEECEAMEKSGIFSEAGFNDLKERLARSR